MNKPKVSVIMGIYNCESTLESSLNSLLSQQYQDFEVIMCDDGSNDNTFNIAMKYCEKYPDKFIILSNNKNMGLNYTLNNCLKHTRGKYIARMDGDDISLPHRFKKEVEFLDNHPNISIVSSAMIYFDEDGDWGVGEVIEYPQKSDLVKGTIFAHAPCMVKSEAYEAVDGYTVDKKLLRVEDYHLWIKMYSKGYIGYNFTEPLYKMRDDHNALKRRNFKGKLNETYVKFVAIRELKLPFWMVIYTFRPILVGLLPKIIYKFLHKKKLSRL